MGEVPNFNVLHENFSSSSYRLSNLKTGRGSWVKVAFKAFDSASLRPRPHLKLLSCLEGEAFLFLDLFVPGATLPGVKDNGAYVPKMVEPWVDVQRNILHRVAHID